MTSEYQIVFHYTVRIINVDIDYMMRNWWKQLVSHEEFTYESIHWKQQRQSAISYEPSWMNVSRSIRLLSIRLFCWIRFVIHRITSKSESLGFLDSLYCHCRFIALLNAVIELLFMKYYKKKNARKALTRLLFHYSVNWVPRKFRFAEKFLIYKEYRWKDCNTRIQEAKAIKQSAWLHYVEFILASAVLTDSRAFRFFSLTNACKICNHRLIPLIQAQPLPLHEIVIISQQYCRERQEAHPIFSTFVPT